jgi:hypothetical protein
MYADHNVKIFGNSEDFEFSCDLIHLDAMTFGNLTHSMRTEIDVFDGLRHLSVIEHLNGEALRVSVGDDSVNLPEGECFLIPPHQPHRAALDALGIAVTTLDGGSAKRCGRAHRS